MKKQYLFTLPLISILSCNSSIEHRNTIEVCDDLYVETYLEFSSGAYGGDIVYHYLTDSSKFRIYIGKFDNSNGEIGYTCTGDSIVVVKQFRYRKYEKDSLFTILKKEIILSSKKLKEIQVMNTIKYEEKDFIRLGDI